MNEYLQFILQKFEPLLSAGYSGAYFDLFSYAYGVGVGTRNPGRFRYTYNRWDGFSVDLWPNFTIAKKKADLCLLSAEGRKTLVEKIIDLSHGTTGAPPSIVVNDMGVADSIRELPIHHFAEEQLPQGYSQVHLSTPLVLGWTPGYTKGSVEDGKQGSWWRNWTHATNADLLADMTSLLLEHCYYNTGRSRVPLPTVVCTNTCTRLQFVSSTQDTSSVKSVSLQYTLESMAGMITLRHTTCPYIALTSKRTEWK